MDKQASIISGGRDTRSVGRGGSGCDAPIIPNVLRMIRISKKRCCTEAVTGDTDEFSNCKAKNPLSGQRSNTNSYNCYHCNGGYSSKRELIKHLDTHFGASNLDVDAESSNVLDIKDADSKRQELRRKGNGPIKEISGGTQEKGKGRKGRKFAVGTDPCVESVSSNSSPWVRDIKKGKCSSARERPFTCSVCNKCFTKSSTLNNHMRVHTGEKNYSCGVCNKSFSLRGTLTRHKRTHT
ncbi:zinc finger protein 599-like [Ischnura elegans]|uniref:zinc finger protein 599-like n=1 Tax=Ischnura elegans TaxID=197161 RepID=UPI001ED8ABB1|nr:zinc finger protein 599-like [Ischnura elegans]